MPICSYLVIAETGAIDDLARRLEAVPGCDVARAENRDLLLLVTDTPGPDEDATLRGRLERMDGIHALVLAFGEIDPATPQGDPVATWRKGGRRRLPVVDPGGLDFPALPAKRPADGDGA